MKIEIKSLARLFDWPIFIVPVLLTLLGLSVIYSTTLTSGGFLFEKQVAVLLLGLVAVGALALLDYRRLGSSSWWLYGFAVVLLLAVLLFGTNIRGTTGWFVLGPFTFQPVEIVKIIVVIVLAYYFSLHSSHSWHDWWQSLLIIAPVILLLALQPDFGPIFILLAVWLTINALRGLNKRGWLVLIVCTAAVLVIGWLAVLRPDQQDRIRTFLNPSQDPTGRGFQVRQSLIAVGSGGIAGAGLGSGSQSQLKFLPEAPTDFVFAALLEQLGLVGYVLLLILWMLLFWRLLTILKRARDNFTAFLILGLTLLLAYQTMVNVAMNLGLAPIVGLPLPFLSYGGSALLSAFIIIGILESIAVRQKL